MKEIILAIIIVGLFIFFFYFLFNLYKKEKVKKQEKVVEKKSEQNEKEDIPEILKEITLGNYMHDISKTEEIDGVVMEEDNTIEKPELDAVEKVEKAFDDIDDIEIDGVDTEDIEDEIVDSTELLLESEDDEEEDGKKLHTLKKSLADEYKGLSKNMKALIIANILEKKHK